MPRSGRRLLQVLLYRAPPTVWNETYEKKVVEKENAEESENNRYEQSKEELAPIHLGLREPISRSGVMADKRFQGF